MTPVRLLVAMNYQQHLANSAAIRAEIQRFESVHPNIYSIYELLERVEEPLLQNQIREHVIAIEGKREKENITLSHWLQCCGRVMRLYFKRVIDKCPVSVNALHLGLCDLWSVPCWLLLCILFLKTLDVSGHAAPND